MTEWDEGRLWLDAVDGWKPAVSARQVGIPLDAYADGSEEREKLMAKGAGEVRLVVR